MKLQEGEIGELVQRKLEGESYTQIREGLAEKGFSGEEIRDIIREVDERVLKSEIEQGNREKGRSWYWAGMTAAIAGLVLTFGSNAGWFLQGVPRWIVYAPFFLGILLVYYGKWLQKRPDDPVQQGPGRIRKKRPYK